MGDYKKPSKLPTHISRPTHAYVSGCGIVNIAKRRAILEGVRRKQEAEQEEALAPQKPPNHLVLVKA